jgi:macrolide transport system ATP-binding/permease protein
VTDPLEPGDREREIPPPPGWARLVLWARTPRRLHEFLAGDLEESYRDLAAREGVRAARRWYRWQVRQTLRPRAMRSRPTTATEISMIGRLGHDFAEGARMLRRSPGFAAAAVLMLALGIGVNTTVFSWLNAVLLSPIPGAADPGRIMQLGTTFKGNIDTSFSYPDYKQFRDTPGFSGVVARSERPFTLVVPDTATGVLSAPERAWSEVVSDNFFSVLGVQPVAGRAFVPSDARIGDAPVAVISDELWARRFARESAIAGRRILVNGHPVTVVGVAPPAFQGSVPGLAMDLWLPVTQVGLVAPDANNERLSTPGWHWLEIIARPSSGIGPGEARARFATTYAALAGQRSRRADVTGTAFLLRDAEGGSIGLLRPVLLVLTAVAGLVLLIACANLANLLLVRAARRRRELAVRVSLGASRSALMRLLFAESALLAIAGAVVALALTTWTSGLLTGFAPPSDAPISLRAPLDLRVLLFTVAAAIGTAVLLGTLPAWTATSGNLVDALKYGTPGAGSSRQRVRAGLVVLQVSLSVVLLAAAGLCIRSLMNARGIPTGFNTSGMLLASLDLFPRASNDAVARSLYRSLLESVSRIPGVTAVTLAENVPLGLESGSWTTITVDGYQPAPDERVSAAYNFVGPAYFGTLQTPLLRGRDFTLADDERGERVVIVNEAMARRFWPGRDPLGSRVRFWDEKWMRVIGIAADAKQSEIARRASPYFYVPLMQVASESVTLHVRSASDVAALAGGVRDAVHAVDPSIPVFNVRAFAEHIRAATFRQRLAGSLLSVFGLLAVILATVGLYAVLALLVGQRTREFGIRLALGATSGNLQHLVLREAVLLASVGVVLGVAGALVLGRALEDLLIGVAPSDAVTLGAAAAILGTAALVACLAPARRASRLDPVHALRQD